MGKLIRFPRRKRPKDAGERSLFPAGSLGVPGEDLPRTKGSDAHATTWFPSDASPSQEPVAGAPIDPEIDRRRRRRRAQAIGAFVAIFLAGTATAIFGDRGYLDVQRQQRLYRDTKAEVALHQERVQALKREVDRLHADPTAIERIAREQLGEAPPGEIVLLLPGEDTARPTNLDGKVGSAIVPAVRKNP